MLQRLVSHHRAKVRTANANVDHVTNALSRVSLPHAALDAIGKLRHLVQHSVDLGHHVLSIHDDARATRGAQSDVQHSAVLGDVDIVAAEHRVDPGAQARFNSQLHEQPKRLASDAVLRVVEENPDGLGGQTLATLGVGVEKLAKMQVFDFLLVSRQGLPGWTCGERFIGCRHKYGWFNYLGRL